MQNQRLTLFPFKLRTLSMSVLFVGDRPPMVQNCWCLLSIAVSLSHRSLEGLHQSFGSLTHLPVTQRDDYPGHDWLASTVFLIMAGDVDRSLGFLLSLSSLLTSAFIWPARVHASVSRATSWKYAAKLQLAKTATVKCDAFKSSEMPASLNSERPQ